MKKEKKKYIVKGRIRELNYSTNHRKIRYGSPHFLPLEEVCFYNERRVREFALCDNKISVRGRHRNGTFKAKRTNVRFLEVVRLHEIIDPTTYTLQFIRKNNLLFVEEGSILHAQVLEVLDYLDRQDIPKIEKVAIDDEQFVRARAFVFYLQELIANGDYERVVSDIVQYPLRNRRWVNGKKIRENLDEDSLRLIRPKIFTKATEESILQTKLDTLFPSERFMWVGSLRIDISKDYDFRIVDVESLDDNHMPKQK